MARLRQRAYLTTLQPEVCKMLDNVRQLRPAQEPERWGGYFPSEITERPPARHWIIDGMIPRGEFVLLAGAPKVAKSKLLQQMLTSAALEMPFVGKHIEKTRCLGLFLEDSQEELSRRQWQICMAYGVDISVLNMEMELNPREWLDTKLVEFKRGSDEPKWTELGLRLWSIVADFGYQLVVIDTATKAFGWPAKWSGDRASNVAQLVRWECARHDCTVVVTDHTNRADAGGFAGVNTWWGSVRAAMNLRIPTDEMTREPIRGERVLRDLGSNYGSFDPIPLVWDHEILVPKEPETLEQRPKTALQRLEFYHEIIRYLGKCVQNGAKVASDELERRSLPNRVRKWRKLPLNDLYAAQQWGLDHNLIQVVRVAGEALIRPKGMKYDGEND